jgi:hypothetical protein
MNLIFIYHKGRLYRSLYGFIYNSLLPNLSVKCKLYPFIVLNNFVFFNIFRGADKTVPFPIFLFAAQPKEFSLDVLKKLKQRSHNCVCGAQENM